MTRCVTVHLHFDLRMNWGPPAVWHHCYSHQETSAGAIGSERRQVFRCPHKTVTDAGLHNILCKLGYIHWHTLILWLCFIHTTRFALAQRTFVPSLIISVVLWKYHRNGAMLSTGSPRDGWQRQLFPQWSSLFRGPVASTSQSGRLLS